MMRLFPILDGIINCQDRMFWIGAPFNKAIGVYYSLDADLVNTSRLAANNVINSSYIDGDLEIG